MSGEVVSIREAKVRRRLAERAAALARCEDALDSAARSLADAIVEAEDSGQRVRELEACLANVELQLGLVRQAATREVSNGIMFLAGSIITLGTVLWGYREVGGVVSNFWG